MKSIIYFARALSFLLGSLFLLIINLTGCKKDDNATTPTGTANTNVALQIVPREPAYKGSFPVVSTSQTKCWDSTGNIIVSPATNAPFYGQDAQFTHISPIYTKSGAGEERVLNYVRLVRTIQ